MKFRFIINPYSGRRKRMAGMRQLVADFIAARGLDAGIDVTEGPGHGTVLARAAAAAGCARVVAVGGDGTLNEVAQALLKTPAFLETAALGLVPCGTGNGLARHLGLPLGPLRALEVATDPKAEILRMDTGTVNGWPFFNLMGLGFDADVGRRFNQLTRRSLLTYLREGVAAFVHRRSERCVITVAGVGDAGAVGLGAMSAPGGGATMEILLICVANSDQYGNGAVIAPGARVDDGALDLVAIGPAGYAGAARDAIRLFRGNLHQSPRVRAWRGERFTIARAAPGPIHTDGDLRDAGAVLEVGVLPASLRVVVPAGTIR